MAGSSGRVGSRGKAESPGPGTGEVQPVTGQSAALPGFGNPYLGDLGGDVGVVPRGAVP